MMRSGLLFDLNVMSGVRLALCPGCLACLETGLGRIVFIASEAGVKLPTQR